MTAQAILDDIGPLLGDLAAIGFGVVTSRYDAQHFGDFVVKLAGAKSTLSLVRDRGQYLLDGYIDRLKEMGLHRAFDSRDEFRKATLEYVRAVV
jgi:hypothetical protein